MNRKYLILLRTEIDLIWNRKCVILYETQMKRLSRSNCVEVQELFLNSNERIDSKEQGRSFGVISSLKFMPIYIGLAMPKIGFFKKQPWHYVIWV